MVFICRPGISDGVFHLRMGNIWFCKLMLLFETHAKTDTGIQGCFCFCAGGVQVPKKSRSYFAYFIMTISHILIYLYTAWADRCHSNIVYKRSETAQVMYVVPMSCILGQGQCHSTFEERQQTFQAQYVITQRTDVTAVVVVHQQLAPYMGNQAIVAMNDETTGKRLFIHFKNSQCQSCTPIFNMHNVALYPE
jgi:hypothetical protein